ncbi:hypothetical protein ADH76_12975 [Enterocloster clostridioformis]|uniref:hypothetical protein n=1 Tax=Enterocloster clostridioformis TaxID=1531 RepID=UPI00080CA5C9|nr:hypothetical protein [Enterocloster clostridioformis]ANU48022.1 hypothetical protein A4V08_21670 [Lachnoclostridium sp. YL32]NDO32533.1 hypothetical protein [Enterocloster clostridioformis]OXE69266.1 hypothetical protein ADH76_12975 [Enterocloster clostridioformis]QQR03085.1 hypothetical protein I5Q83_13150 [Enterocloster clostridioformis]
MKTYRSTFEENYKAVQEPCNNRKGFKMRYVYIGRWYVWNIPPGQLQTAKRLIGTACVFSVLLFLLGGLVDSPLNYDRYVELPGLLSIAALLFEVIGVVQFCTAKERLTCIDFQDIRTKLHAAPFLHGVLLFCTAMAAMFRMAGCALADAVVPLCYFLSGLLSVTILLYFRSLPYRVDINTENNLVP